MTFRIKKKIKYNNYSALIKYSTLGIIFGIKQNTIFIKKTYNTTQYFRFTQQRALKQYGLGNIIP